MVNANTKSEHPFARGESAGAGTIALTEPSDMAVMYRVAYHVIVIPTSFTSDRPSERHQS